ncbi:MAG: hypothetical protein IJ784_05615 [Ruminiclostridium sp.]|nr:hypothetical protein [Ruminiclostridium sp.]
MANQKTAKKQGRGIKEVIRKSLVSLKRSPQSIPMVFLIVGFLIFSLNLSSIANTTARINGANMGQCEFVAMLFSILAFVVFLRTFPKRKPANKIMLGLLFGMLALLIFVDYVYITRIVTALTRADNPIVVDAQSTFINTAQTVVTLHIVFVGITVVLLALLPVYSKLIRKINTSIEVEGNENMDVIDVSDDED